MPDPFLIDLEAQALGILLLAPDTWPLAAEALTPDHFHREAHRQLWSLLVQMQAEGTGWTSCLEPIMRAISLGTLDDMGGGAYMASLPEKVASTEALSWLCTELEKERQRRHLRSLDGRLREAGTSDPGELRAVLDKGLRELDARDRGGWRTGQELATSIYEAVQRREEDRRDGKPSGNPTGIPFVDRLTGGLRAPQYWVIGARPSHGKSALVRQWALHLAGQGLVVADFSLEMPATASKEDPKTIGVTDRMLAHLGLVELSHIRDGQLTLDEWAALTDASDRLASLPYYLDDRPACVSQVRTRLQALRQKVGRVDVVVLDYLQLLQREPGTRYGSRAEEIGAYSHAIQGLLKDHGCAGLIVASLSRAVDARQDKRPMASDLRESGDIESDADVVLMLYRPEMYDSGDRPGEVELILRKTRSGETGSAWCKWEGGTQWVREIDRRYGCE